MTTKKMDLYSSTAEISKADVERAIRLARTIRAVTFAAHIVAVGAAVVRGVRWAMAAFRTAREKAHTRATLSALSAHELADIGLTHSDIDAVVDGRDPLADVRGTVAQAQPAPVLRLIDTPKVSASSADGQPLAA